MTDSRNVMSSPENLPESLVLMFIHWRILQKSLGGGWNKMNVKTKGRNQDAGPLKTRHDDIHWKCQFTSGPFPPWPYKQNTQLMALGLWHPIVVLLFIWPALCGIRCPLLTAQPKEQIISILCQQIMILMNQPPFWIPGSREAPPFCLSVCDWSKNRHVRQEPLYKPKWWTKRTSRVVSLDRTNISHRTFLEASREQAGQLALWWGLRFQMRTEAWWRWRWRWVLEVQHPS